MTVRGLARAVLVIAVALGVACSAEPRVETISAETTDIKGGQWKAYEFTAQRNLRLTVDVKVSRGPAINLTTMTNEGYLAWQQAQKRILGGGQFHFYPGLSAESIRSGTRTGALGPGQYVVVVHNPEVVLFAEKVATVEVKITAQ